MQLNLCLFYSISLLLKTQPNLLALLLTLCYHWRNDSCIFFLHVFLSARWIEFASHENAF